MAGTAYERLNPYLSVQGSTEFCETAHQGQQPESGMIIYSKAITKILVTIAVDHVIRSYF